MNGNEETSKSANFSAIRAFSVEIIVIFGITALIVVLLNAFHLIDLKALFSQQQAVQSQKQATLVIKKDDQEKQNEQIYLRGTYNPAQPSFVTIATEKVMHYAQTISEFEGSIKEIDLRAGFDDYFQATYSARLIVSVGSGSATVKLLYPNEGMDKVRIVNPAGKKLSFTDLKTGDKIMVKTNTGILRQYPNNINEVLIEKK